MTKLTRILAAIVLWAMVAVTHAGTHHYYYTDPQGTVLAKADGSGTIIATYDYAPYGTAVASMSPAPDGPGYTGHVNDPDSGLVYMQARYYDPGVGRFLSVDPVGPMVGNGFNFGRYGYANNNPVINTDPTGMHSASEGDGFSDSTCAVYHCETIQASNDSAISAPISTKGVIVSKNNANASIGQQNTDAALQEFMILLRDGKLPQAYNFAKKIAYSAKYHDEVGQKRSELGGGAEGGHSRYTSADSYEIDLFKGSASTVRLAFQVIAHEILHGEPTFWNFYINVISHQGDKVIRRNQLDMLHGQMQPYINQATKAFDADYIPTLPTVEVRK